MGPDKKEVKLQRQASAEHSVECSSCKMGLKVILKKPS
jgi:hypothetical protein